MRKQAIFSIIAATLLSTAFTTAQAGWVSASNGTVPAGALESGNEANGATLYACRAQHNGGMHPGKVRSAFRACNIGWGGKEIAISNYQVYVIWQQAQNGQVPAGAVAGGQEANGEKLYICRGNYQGGIHSGKVRGAFGGCNISWGGKEVKINPYQVLVH